MKKLTQRNICMIPIILWLIIIPLIVKAKFFTNPLAEYPWYPNDVTLVDFFLYYKSVFITITGILMLLVMCWQYSTMKRKEVFVGADMKIFVPILIYLVLAIFSSLFSQYSYFCTHGMPDQFETIWNLVAYIVAIFYCYYLIVWQNAEIDISRYLYIGAGMIGIICVLQYLKIDIYRLMYARDEYSFTFEEGTVYGPFYNINYVGSYVLLLLPFFVLMLLFDKNWKAKITSAVLSASLIIAMIGAESDTAYISLICIIVFAVFFLVLKHAREKKHLWVLIVAMLFVGIGTIAMFIPRVQSYISLSNTELANLENIFTNDDNIEIDYNGQKMFISMFYNESGMIFTFLDQNMDEVAWESAISDDGYTYYRISEERYGGMTISPAMFSRNPDLAGFVVTIDGKDWCFTNQTQDGTYYYLTGSTQQTKLSSENISADFKPFVNISSFANGRGYIWNKTITLLKDYILFGSGADTYALVYPNNDFVDKYNNAYDNMIITKPHNLYLQIAVQTGVLSLICFIVFYVWYFISSIRIYYKRHLDCLLNIMGFAIMLGTFGYMIAGLANDSTVTVAPMYWALMGVGIGINRRIQMQK